MRKLSRKVEWHASNSGSIAQVYSSGMQYAFCSPDYKQQLPWVFCKDFLHDVIFSHIHNTDLSIYGYVYKPGTSPLPPIRRMRLLLNNRQDADFGSKMENALEFVRQLEGDMEMPSKSHVFECLDPPKTYAKCGVYMFSGSGDWLLAPPLVSLYTLAIRVGCVHVRGTSYKDTMAAVADGKISPYQSNDAMQIRSATKGIARIVKEGYRSIFGDDKSKNYPAGTPVSTMHNYFGIMSFSDQGPQVPHWKKAARRVAAKA